jgi:uncharacterized secreted protein with C-terminal beta-propeller domain
MVKQSTVSMAVLTVTLAVALVLVSGAFGFLDAPGADDESNTNDDVNLKQFGTTDLNGPSESPELATFESSEQFQEYLEAGQRNNGGWFGSGLQITVGPDVMVEEAPMRQGSGDAAGGSDDGSGGSSGFRSQNQQGGNDGSERHSETNVQEAALDEPDVLKTDGESVYYSGYHFQQTAHETTILDIEDPANPERAATIPAAGELLLVEDSETLVVFGDGRIWGYDISDPSSPEQRWNEPLDASLQTARLYEDSLYLVLVDRPETDEPCPITPYAGKTVECTDIYRPDSQANADAVYTAMELDPETGGIQEEASIVGSADTSAVYVSENAIYLSYTRSTSQFELMSSYITGPGSEHVDEDVVDEIENLRELNISQQAKQTELNVIMGDWRSSLDESEREEAIQAFDEGLREYMNENNRAMTMTGIVSIGIGDDDMSVDATGEVPGHPLNQWSMDEHEGHLRIATTIPGRMGSQSVNDVYVLDDDLSVTGSVTGLGEGQRVYSVRFEGDLGYVVTFRQIDPFYTLDLSNPDNPIKEGELEVPGVSHYLHPLQDEGDYVLGVGEEAGSVKLSIFDVSDRSNPTEEDVKILDSERFSEANQNHNAFLQDERHGVFFMPAGDNSYVFSYENGQLEEEARVNIGGRGVRAMYVDNYLYVFGSEEIVVLDEETWEVETRLDSR